MTPSELESVANTLRDWATQLDDLATKLRDKSMNSVGIRNVPSLNSGSALVNSFLSEAVRAVNEQVWRNSFQAETEDRVLQVAEKTEKYKVAKGKSQDKKKASGD